MTWYRVCLACVAGVALAACHDTKQGVLQPKEPVAYLRYVNVVPDTGAVDFRIVDIVGDAPSAGAATFRTGGYPSGIPTNFLPPHQQVQAGAREIRVFPNSTNPQVTSQYLLDTTITFTAGVYYTFYLYGSAKDANGLHALVAVDTGASPGASQVAFRVLNLAPSLAGAAPTLADTTVRPDVWIKTPDAAIITPFSGSPVAAATPYGTYSAYSNRATGTYWIGLSATGSTNPIGLFTTAAGTAGTATSNPVAGTNVAGSAITLVVVPRSRPNTSAPQTGGAPKTAVSVTRSNDTVTATSGYQSTWVRRTVDSSGTRVSRADTVVSPSSLNKPHGLAAGNFASISGANEQEYNGWKLVTVLADTTTCMPVDSLGDARRLCTALDTVKNVVKTNWYRFRYRIAGTPASPATGTVIIRGPHTVSDYTIPALIALIDKKPALTAP